MMNQTSENANSSSFFGPYDTWYSFSSVHPQINWLQVCALSSNILLGLPTNSWVLWLLLKGSRDMLSSEIFACNLALSDLMYCLNVPLSFLNYFVWNQSARCLSFFSGLVIFGRPLFLCCISVERYVAVCHPLAFPRFRPPRRRLACVGGVWTAVAGGCLCCVFVGPSTLNRVTLACMLAFLSVKIWCCLAVLRALSRPAPGEGRGPGAGQPGRGQGAGQPAKQKAFRIVLFNLVYNLVDYLPLMVVLMLRDVLPASVFQVGSSASFLISVFCAFVQPVHFLFRAGKLQCIVGKTCS